MDHISLYTQAYEQLNRLTPLKFDCGQLCKKVCCGERDANEGMWLFPGEEELLAGEESFVIRPLERQLENGRSLWWMRCSGGCYRALRPLSCRIFPLTPYLTKQEIILIDIDPRAKSICPLAAGRESLLPDFVRKVGQVCRGLAREPEIKDFIRILSGELDEYRKMARLFGRNL